jgi:hypothetical protein
VLELFEALADPAKSFQDALTWPVPVPARHRGAPYADCAAALLATGAVPIGVRRGNTGPLPYAIAATPGNTALKLEASDLVYVLAPVAWAAAHLSNGASLSAADA